MLSFLSVLLKTTFAFLGVKFPSQASGVGFTSKGPTAGLLSVSDVSEEKPPAAAAAVEKEAEQNDENNEVTKDGLFLFGKVPDNTAALNRAVWSPGNEDKNSSLDLFMKTSNPTLILLAGPFSYEIILCILRIVRL